MATAEPSFKIYIEEAGVYRVSYEELGDAGLGQVELDSSLMGLASRGEPVPVWISDGNDGSFGPGDWVEFVGERLRNEGLYYHDYTRHNVYWLTFDGTNIVPMRARQSEPTVMFGDPAPLWRRSHVEQDQLLIRVRETDIHSAEDADLWFWSKLTHIDKRPTVIDLELPGLAATSGRTVDLRIGVRGMSRPRFRNGVDMPDHRIDLELNGSPLPIAEWDGRSAHTIEVFGLDAALLMPGGNRLTVSVPPRRPPDSDDPVVDVVMLNWVDVVYPHDGEVREDGQVAFSTSPVPGPNDDVNTDPVEILANDTVRLYTTTGDRVDPFVVSGGVPGMYGPNTLRFDSGPAEPFFVTSGSLKHADLVQRDAPSNLADSGNQSDYLMITHSRLKEAIGPLADFHRERGLGVMVVDVEDIYDEFNDGIVHPRAIKEFISTAYHQWQAPAPRFVLFVGDASWDTKNTEVDDRNYANWVDTQLDQGVRFLARHAPVYSEKAALNHRQLVPTWNFSSHQGHSASDNFFVAVDGDDFLPDLAVGRFPVVEPEEVEAIVAKTISYASQSMSGAWRSSALWITNESSSFQSTSDYLARLLAERGFSATKVYPSPEEEDNESHQDVLQSRFEEGQLIVHFLGHGGRHIWRTGPPDFRKNHDLFTLDHVAALQPTDRLSFILSMTCYSAPFDHPNQDSIGELFLRIPDKGAVGVFAASWRNSPSRDFSEAILERLTVPGTPVGEAIRQAKMETRNRTLVETYNLLGDPAIPLALPDGWVDLEVTEDPDGTRVTGRLNLADLDGEGVVEWVNSDLEVVHSVPVDVLESGFRVTVGGHVLSDAGEAAGIRARAVEANGRREAVGWLQLEVTQEPASAAEDGPHPSTEQVDQGLKEQSKRQETR